MRKKQVGVIAIKNFALLVVLGTAYQVMAQDAERPYPKMLPLSQSRWREAPLRRVFQRMRLFSC